MPQAVPVQEKEDMYGYVVKATVAQVREFYDREMSKLGWQSLLVGILDQGGMLLTYENDGKNVMIFVMPAKDNQTAVAIAGN
jgi:hypothetical protein